MRRMVPFLAAAFLAIACWRVYAVRSRLAAGDADPVQLAMLKTNLSQLSRVLADGEYRGRSYEIDMKVIRDAGADAYGSIEYLDRQGRVYRVYIGGAVANAENFHAPSYCLPSGGWEILEDSVVPLVGQPEGTAGSRMKRLALQHGQSRMVVYYWFQAGTRTTHDEFMVRYYRFVDLLMGQPFRPTMIVTVYVPADDDMPTADTRGFEFLNALGPHLTRALNGEDENSWN